jgi:hypothetical protein
MGIIKEIFQQHAPEYLDRHGKRMPDVHKKVIRAIINCKTDVYGITRFQCEQCGSNHFFSLSCGNRHCPNCQYHKSRLWLDSQMQKQLPGHHFMVTFTMPEQIRDFLRSHQKKGYGAMFTAAAETMKKLAADPKFMGGDLPGFFGVLHTWGRTLQYHPHLHFVVAGGAFSSRDELYHPSANRFYLPVKAMSAIFRARFKDLMRKNRLLHLIPPETWARDWNVNCQPVGNSEASMKYLAPYVFRVAISDSRIIGLKDRRISFRYKKQGSKRIRVMTLDVMEFIRRFLQHVLPQGFMKIRYYGFMHPCCSLDLDTVRDRICAGLKILLPVIRPKKQKTHQPACPLCKGILVFKAFYPPPPARFALEPG